MTTLSSAGGPGLGKRTYAFLRSIPTGVLWILVVLWTIPSLGLLVNSFRTRNAQRSSGWWAVVVESWSETLTLDNYVDILAAGAQGGLWRALLNSLAIALPATVIPIAFAAFAAYAFAWIDFKGREWLFIATVSLLAIPAQMSLIPLLQLYSGGGHLTLPILDKTLTLFPDLDLAGRHISVWLTHTGFALPFAIFQFLWTYNDYLIAVTMLGGAGQNFPATARIAALAGEFGQAEHLLTAGAFLSTLLPIIVFFALQRFFVTGILAGSVKG